MKTLFPEGHDVMASGLAWIETSREWEDRQRTLALIGDFYGVISGMSVSDASVAGNCRVQVSPGLAIDPQGYRVVLDAATTVSGLTAADIGKYVTVQKSNVDIFSTAHPITGAAAYTRETDGASVVVSGSCASGLGCVVLACIDNVVTGGAASVSLSTNTNSCRKTLRISPDRLGVGMDVTEHRLSAHADGISGGTGSLIPSIINSTTDYIQLTPMQVDNWLSINGVLLGTDEVNPAGDINVVFTGGGVDPSGSWNIYINSTGAAGKTQSALTADQFLLATVTFDTTPGELSNLVDERVFYEITQDLVRVDLNEAQTNDSLTESSTLKNNLNRIRYRLNTLETTAGGAYPVIGNVNCDFNGSTDAIFTTAIASLPASGGTLMLADGTWTFGNYVVVDKPVRFVANRGSVIALADGVANAFLVQSNGLELEGIEFDVNYASGGTVHVVDIADFSNFAMRNCILTSEVALAGANLYGEFVRIAGGSDFVVEGNRFESDTAQMYLVRVIQSAGNTTSGLRIDDNLTYGLGCANLFHLDSGDAKCVSISRNIGVVGVEDGLRMWIESDSGTSLYGAAVVGNTYECTNVNPATYPAFILFSHVGGGTIVGNILRFASPGTSYAFGIQVADDFTICGNQIRTAYLGIVVSDRCAVNGNTMWGITGEGINIVENNNAVVGNVIYGSGNKGIDILGDNNIVDGNTLVGFASGVVDGGGGNWVGITDKTSNLVV